MPTLTLQQNGLLLHLSPIEKALSLHRDIFVPLSDIRGATDDAGFSTKDLGLRCPGTHLPGSIAAGTFYKQGDKQFVYITRGKTPVVIELRNQKWQRLVVGVENATDTALKIAAAVASCGSS